MDRFSAAVMLTLRLLAERIVRAPMHPRLRGHLLRALGARIGAGVRIDEVTFMNLSVGFTNLTIGHHSYIGAGTIIDLIGNVEIGANTAISPGCALMTHSDPGSTFGNELAAQYPRRVSGIRIGDHCWIGVRATILQGVSIGDRVVVGAGALVTKDIASGSVAVGMPAKTSRKHSDPKQ